MIRYNFQNDIRRNFYAIMYEENRSDDSRAYFNLNWQYNLYAQPWYDRTVIWNNLSKENFVLAKWSTSSPHKGFFLRFLRSFLFKKLMFSNLVNITFHFVKIWMDACMSMCLCVCMYNLFWHNIDRNFRSNYLSTDMSPKS